LADLPLSPQLQVAVLEHALRGVRLQVALRGVLVVFVILTVAVVPPQHDAAACYVVAGVYAAWAAAIGFWSWRGGTRALRFAWMAAFFDLAALAALAVLAGASAQQSWTADVLVSGFVLVPLLAATQLRPGVCAAVVVPTIAAYFASSVATKSANAEPWDSILLRTLVVCGVGFACVALSWIQRSRVLRIVGLLDDRTRLVGELVSTEERQRRALAEQLHDGALQFLLGARYDLEDARELGDPEAFGRLQQALDESSQLLRLTVRELHPAVLEQAGLARAVQDLANATSATGRLRVTVALEGWQDELRTPNDGVLYGVARELLTNVVKHAQARSAQITLAHENGVARLRVTDDGRGIMSAAALRSPAEGHIGLASHRARIEAAGGTLSITGTAEAGTVACVELPLERQGPAPSHADLPQLR
jgi:two-component system NarL family sensor kinase